MTGSDEHWLENSLLQPWLSSSIPHLCIPSDYYSHTSSIPCCTRSWSTASHCSSSLILGRAWSSTSSRITQVQRQGQISMEQHLFVGWVWVGQSLALMHLIFSSQQDPTLLTPPWSCKTWNRVQTARNKSTFKIERPKIRSRAQKERKFYICLSNGSKF